MAIAVTTPVTSGDRILFGTRSFFSRWIEFGKRRLFRRVRFRITYIPCRSRRRKYYYYRFYAISRYAVDSSSRIHVHAHTHVRPSSPDLFFFSFGRQSGP